MALAILIPQGSNGEYYQFKADIGTNRYYQYRIGKSKKRYKGVEIIEEVTHRSPLMEAQQAAQRLLHEDFLIQVPKTHLGRDADKIQLFSFKDKKGLGMALSDVVHVLSTLQQSDGLFPSLSFELETANMDIPVKYKPCTYREPPLSEGMFWGAIVNALPSVLKVAAPIVGKLLNKGGGGKEASKVGGNEILDAIMQLLGDLKNQNSNGTTATAQSISESMAINPAMLMQLAPLLQKVASPETINAIGDQPVKLFKAIGDAVLKMDAQEMAHLEKLNPGVDDPTIVPILASMSLKRSYSEAKIAPALLAALPALAPMVQKLVSPEMINAIGNQPVKLFKAIGDAVLKMDKQEMEHLERLNPGMDDPTIVPILASMSIPSSLDVAIPFQFNSKLEMDFVNTTTVKLKGKSRVVYKKGSELHFPVKIYTKETDAPKRAIPKVIMQAIFQDGETNDVLLEKKSKLKDVMLGNIFDQIILTEEETAALPTHKDIKLELSFIWRGKKSKRNVGTFKIHHFTLIDDYSFDRIGEKVGEMIPLNDLVKYRPFWHKVWEGGFSDSRRWEVDFDLKYFYALDLQEDAISKLDTRRKIVADNAKKENEPHRRKIEAKLKSGLELSLKALNELLTTLNQPALEEEKLQALKCKELQNYYNQVARINVEMKGRSGDTGTLWTYPEVCIHQVHLMRPSEVNEIGQVIKLEEEIVQFPRPASIHFIGTKSE